MHISGAVVQIRPDRREVVGRTLAVMPGVEVHLGDAQGRLIVTVEGKDSNALVDTLTRVSDIDGVLSVAAVYHHFEAQGTEEMSA
jgi:nitrate reductase NapD